MRKFDNFKSHLNVLTQAKELDIDDGFMGEIIVSGIIDKFKIQFELCWKVLKELLEHENVMIGPVGSPRNVIKAAYQYFDFMNEGIWLAMLEERNRLTHVYDPTAARKAIAPILTRYIPEFQRMQAEIERLYGEELENL